MAELKLGLGLTHQTVRFYQWTRSLKHRTRQLREGGKEGGSVHACVCVCVCGVMSLADGALILAEGADALQLWVIVVGSFQDKPEIWILT